jgi:hypothetical protein
MTGKTANVVAGTLVAFGTLGTPTIASAQRYGYVNDDRPTVVVECGPGQRAVMEQTRTNGGTQVVARCEGSAVRGDTYLPVARRSAAQFVERTPRRSKTKTALMIAGSAATGAGVGGALKGKSGALIGAAIGGGAASIYEAAKRR